MSKTVIFFKTHTEFDIGGATSDRWSAKMQDNWMAKTTVREDREGNLWLTWSGGSAESRGDHKIPAHNIAQISYAVEVAVEPKIDESKGAPGSASKVKASA